MTHLVDVDLMTQTARRNGRLIIRNGTPVNGYRIRRDPVTFQLIERLYEEYKNSVPDGIAYRHQYFMARPYEDFSPEELLSGGNRQDTKSALELTLLEGVLNGSLRWPDRNGWFWQSPNDKDLVILREWIRPERTSQ